MNIKRFIESHKELSELPFLVVYRTILILKDLNALKIEVAGGENVEI